MRTSIAIVGLVLVTAVGLAAQGTQSTQGAQGTQTPQQRNLETLRVPQMLEVAVRGYLAGGKMGSMAGETTSDRLESYVWADQTLCGMGAGDSAPPNVPWIGWHFTGTVLEDSPGQLVIRVEWQRLWDKGAKLQNGPSGTQTLTVRNGERVELDRVEPSKEGKCGTTDARLEAAVLPRTPYLAGLPFTGGYRGAGVGGARGGRGVGGTGGVAAGGRGTGTGTGAGRGAQGDAATGAQGGRGFYVFNARVSYDAEVWLVHRKPDGTEDVQQQTLRFGAGARTFSFPAVQVAGTGGAMTVDISGSLQLAGPAGLNAKRLNFSNSNSGATAKMLKPLLFARGAVGATPDPSAQNTTTAQPMMVVSIARRAFRTTPFVDTRGTTDMSIQIPQSSDVLSFELPPLQKATEDLLKGHVFSIRLRVTPVK